jgi:hypothetical protein
LRNQFAIGRGVTKDRIDVRGIRCEHSHPE